MGWNRLWGQDKRVDAFKRAIKENSLAHAIFLWGPKGVGKSVIAEELASHWLCLDPSENGACGKCRSCQLWDHENHPDNILIGLEEGARTIGIEAARQVSKILSLAPNIQNRRVIRFPQASSLTVEASNSLLKAIEEPPEGTLFILEARSEEEVLPTIRSRCQCWSVPPVSEQTAVRWLVEINGFSEDEAIRWARLSGGVLGFVLENQQEDGTVHRDAVLQWLSHLTRWNGAEIIQAAGELDKSKKDKQAHPIISQIDIAFSIFRDLLIYEETRNLDLLIHQDQKKKIETLHADWNGVMLIDCWELLKKAQMALQRNGNPRLWTEWLWIQFSQKLDNQKRHSPK